MLSHFTILIAVVQSQSYTQIISCVHPVAGAGGGVANTILFSGVGMGVGVGNGDTEVGVGIGVGVGVGSMTGAQIGSALEAARSTKLRSLLTSEKTTPDQFTPT